MNEKYEEPMKRKLFGYYLEVKFLLTLIAAVLCLTIVVLWSVYSFPPGMRNFSTYVIFTHTGPAYTIILWGFIVSYILGEEPPAKLQIIYCAVGCLLFAIIGILQLLNVDNYNGYKVLILFLVHIATSLLLAIILFLSLQKRKEEPRTYIVHVSQGGVPFYK